MESDRTNQIFTIPNIISFSRILLLIPISICIWNNNLIAVAILASISFISDYLDGIIARRLNQISNLGKILDPLGYKISICVVLIILWLKNIVPTWLVILVVGRDLAILFGGLIVVQKYKIVVTSNFLGKVTVNVLAITVAAYIFHWFLLQKIFGALTIVFVVLSFCNYFIRYVKYVRIEKSIDIKN